MTKEELIKAVDDRLDEVFGVIRILHDSLLRSIDSEIKLVDVKTTKSVIESYQEEILNLCYTKRFINSTFEK